MVVSFAGKLAKKPQPATPRLRIVPQVPFNQEEGLSRLVI
jgi:hypothetical protein